MTDTASFLVRLENCSARLGRTTILHGLDWTLVPGRHCLLLGENGAGKSTLMHLLRGDIFPAPARPGETEGRRIYGPALTDDGLPTESPIGLRQRIALVSAEFQDRYVRRALGEEDRRQWNLTALNLAITGLRDTPLLYSPPEESERRAALAALEALGASHLAGTGVQDMSRGQARLVFIARAVAAHPRVLLCDEVLDGLDPAARQLVSTALKRLAASGETTVVLSTHRTTEASLDWFQDALLMEHGRIKDRGPAAELLACSPAADTRASTRVFKEGGCAPVHEADSSLPWLVRMQNANLTRGGRQALHDVDWTLLPGQRWAVFGRNGAGKSSLLALVTGEERPEPGGQVHWFGDTGLAEVPVVRRRMGMVSPELQAAYPREATVLEAVMSGFQSSMGVFEIPDADPAIMEDLKKRAMQALEAAGPDLAADPSRPVERLSYGQTRRLLIARALVHDPELLLMDEAETGLDGPSRAALLAVVENLAKGGVSMIWVSHTPGALPAGLTHGLIMDNGRVAAAGPLDQVLPLVRQRLG